jgi:anti-sigma-K factor RskA
MEQNGTHELTAAYALDALADHDAREYEEHLRHCDQCRDDLRSLQETAALLSFGVEPAEPPPGLRDRIIDAARAERSNVVPLRPRWAYPAAAAAAVAACAAIGLGIWAATLSHSLSREQKRSVFVQPTSQVVAVKGAPGRLFISSSRKGALVLSQLPGAGTGRTYEAWVIPKGGKPQPAGLFGGGKPVEVVTLTRPVPAGATVAVTKEEAGGSAVPHPPLLITGQA